MTLLLTLLSVLLPFYGFSTNKRRVALSNLSIIGTKKETNCACLARNEITSAFILGTPIAINAMGDDLSCMRKIKRVQLLTIYTVTTLLPMLLYFLSIKVLFLTRKGGAVLLPALFADLILMRLLVILTIFPTLCPFLLSKVCFFALLRKIT